MAVLRNPKWEAFAQAMANGESAEKAYVSAGFQPSRPNAWRLQQNKQIRKRVQEIAERREVIEAKATERAIERLALTKETLARELAALGFSNMDDYTRMQGDLRVLDFTRVGREQMAAVSEFVVDYHEPRTDEQTGESDGGSRSMTLLAPRPIKRVRLKLYDKRAALMDIAKLFGWVIHKTEDVSRLEERLAQMSPEQRRQDAADIYRKARDRLLEDQRGSTGEPVTIENEEPEPTEQDDEPRL